MEENIKTQKKYKEASIWHRLGAYLIDIVLIGLVIGIVNQIITHVISIPDIPADTVEYMSTELQEVYFNTLDNSSSLSFVSFYNAVYSSSEAVQTAFLNWLSTNEVLSYETSVVKAGLLMLGLNLISGALIYFLYLCVLPAFWSKQTIGRLILKVQVVKEGDEKASLGNLTVRDLVGSYILSILNLCCGLQVILNIVFVCTRNRTIGDMISGTHLVTYDKSQEINETFNSNNNYQSEKKETPTFERVSDDDIEIVVDSDNND